MQRVIAWIVLVVFGIGISGCAVGPSHPTAYAYPQQDSYGSPAYQREPYASPAYQREPYGYRQQEPIADRQSYDTAECQNWASQQTGYESSDTAEGAVVGGLIGALGGAAAGAAIGAAVGGGSGAARGAAIGAAAGGIGGAVTGGATAHTRDQQGYDQAFAYCMQRRGYYVR